MKGVKEKTSNEGYQTNHSRPGQNGKINLPLSTTVKQKRLPVKPAGKVIGYLEGTIFYKSVKGSKHKLRTPAAWCIDAPAYDRIIRSSATQIVIHDTETDTEYHSTIENFDSYKGELNRGFGRQYFLVIPRWSVSGEVER